MRKSGTRKTIANLMLLVAIAAVDALLARALHRIPNFDRTIGVFIVVFYDVIAYAAYRTIRHILGQKPGPRHGEGFMALVAMVIFPFTVPCLFFPIFLMILEALGRL